VTVPARLSPADIKRGALTLKGVGSIKKEKK
jgi:hypothetical protein